MQEEEEKLIKFPILANAKIKQRIKYLKPHWYLYRHIRIDNGETFYVGIGTKPKNMVGKTYRQVYSRAFKKNKGRSEFWNRIVNKTNYLIDILVETNDIKQLKELEISYIQFYGRRDLGLGALVNMTDGGDGMLNTIVEKLCKPVYILSKDLNILKEFNTIKDCSNYLGGNQHSLGTVCRLKKLFYKDNYVCFKNDYNEIISDKNIEYKKSFVVHQFDKENNFIREYSQIKEVENYGFTKSNVSRCLENENSTHGGFKFKRIILN